METELELLREYRNELETEPNFTINDVTAEAVKITEIK